MSLHSCFYPRGENKDRPRGPLVSREMGENVLVEVKVIPARLDVQPSTSGPAESSVSFAPLDMFVLAPAVRSRPQSRAVSSVAGVCGQESRGGRGLLLLALGAEVARGWAVLDTPRSSSGIHCRRAQNSLCLKSPQAVSWAQGRAQGVGGVTTHTVHSHCD